MPLERFTTKSFEAFQRPSSCATATASAAMTEFVPSGFEQLINPCSLWPSSSLALSLASSTPRGSGDPELQAIDASATKPEDRVTARANQFAFMLILPSRPENGSDAPCQ